MNILNGIKNFLSLINDNWTTILVIIGLALALWKKIDHIQNFPQTRKLKLRRNKFPKIF